LGPKGCREAARLFVRVEVAEIVVHKTDQPDNFFDLLIPAACPAQNHTEIDSLWRRQVRPEWVTSGFYSWRLSSLSRAPATLRKAGALHKGDVWHPRER